MNSPIKIKHKKKYKKPARTHISSTNYGCAPSQTPGTLDREATQRHLLTRELKHKHLSLAEQLELREGGEGFAFYYRSKWHNGGWSRWGLWSSFPAGTDMADAIKFLELADWVQATGNAKINPPEVFNWDDMPSWVYEELALAGPEFSADTLHPRIRGWLTANLPLLQGKPSEDILLGMYRKLAREVTMAAEGDTNLFKNLKDREARMTSLELYGACSAFFQAYVRRVIAEEASNE